MDEIDRIIAGLSKAQREALLGASETVLMHRLKMTGRSKAMRRLRLCVEAWRGGDLLTPLGLQVRARLEGQG